MATLRPLENRVKARRIERGWSQADLAQRAGVSRAAVSAIEVCRLVPSVATALALAAVFDSTVEELFGKGEAPESEPVWAWAPEQTPCRYWHALVGQRNLLYPAEATVAGVVGHDGLYHDNHFHKRNELVPASTLVIACCDPAAGLLATEVARLSGFRVLVLPRSSRQALALLGEGLVHMAGVHLATESQPNANACTVREKLGSGHRLLRVAHWQEGLAIGPGVNVRSVRSALRADLRWVGREAGSAARQCLDELLPNHRPPRRLARDHRGVAEAIRCGWADIGVCVRLVSAEAGIRFLPVRKECYDLCYSDSAEGDPRIQALVQAVRSTSYRRLLGELPGFDTSAAGDVQSVL